MKKHKKRSKKWIQNGIIVLLLSRAVYFLWSRYQLQTNNGFKQKILASKPTSYTTFGIDISHHQGTIDWEEVFITNELDSTIAFVYFKVTEGVDHADTKWLEHQLGLRMYNKKMGAYHFFLPKRDALLQAKNFLSHYTYSKEDLLPVLDVEIEGFNDKDMMLKIDIWLDEVERQIGKRPIIYTSLHFYETKFKNEFLNEKFWVASYSRQPNLENDKRIVIWQYSESGQIPGINKPVDLNVCHSITSLQ